MDRTNALLFKKAKEKLLEKRSFQPMPGGMPQADPAMMGGGGMPPPADPAMMGGGGMPPPADPAMMGGGGMPPPGMDPAMMGGGGMPPVDPATGMPMDPNMMGMPEPTIGQLTISEFQQLMMETMVASVQELGGAVGGEGEGEMEKTPGNKAEPSNAEVIAKIDELMMSMGAVPQMGAPAGPPMGAPDGMMAGGVPAGEVPGMAPAGSVPGQVPMEISAGVRPDHSLCDFIIDKVTNNHGG